MDYSPVTPEAPRELINASLRLHKDDGFVLLLHHDTLQEAAQPEGTKITADE